MNLVSTLKAILIITVSALSVAALAQPEIRQCELHIIPSDTYDSNASVTIGFGGSGFYGSNTLLNENRENAIKLMSSNLDGSFQSQSVDPYLNQLKLVNYKIIYDNSSHPPLTEQNFKKIDNIVAQLIPSIPCYAEFRTLDNLYYKGGTRLHVLYTTFSYREFDVHGKLIRYARDFSQAHFKYVSPQNAEDLANLQAALKKAYQDNVQHFFEHKLK